MIKIRIIAESDGASLETWWGDYWVKQELGAALERQGVEVTYNESFNRKPVNQKIVDIDLLLHARAPYRYLTAPKKIAWIYTRHYTALSMISYFKSFDHIFTLGLNLEQDFTKHNISCSFLPAATSKRKTICGDKKHDVLFVGNARGNRPQILKTLIDQGIKVSIYGTGWDIMPEFKNFFKEKYWDNRDLHNLYAKSKIILTVHEQEMLQSNSCSIKALDIMASGQFLLTDNLGVKHYSPSVIIYCSASDLIQKIKYYLNNQEERDSIANECSQQCAIYTYDNTARLMLEKVGQL